MERRKKKEKEEKRQAIKPVALTGLLLAVGLDAGPSVGETHGALGTVADLKELVVQSRVVLRPGRLDVDGRLALAAGVWERSRPCGRPCHQKTDSPEVEVTIGGDSVAGSGIY